MYINGILKFEKVYSNSNLTKVHYCCGQTSEFANIVLAECDFNIINKAKIEIECKSLLECEIAWHINELEILGAIIVDTSYWFTWTNIDESLKVYDDIEYSIDFYAKKEHIKIIESYFDSIYKTD